MDGRFVITLEVNTLYLYFGIDHYDGGCPCHMRKWDRLYLSQASSQSLP